MKAIVALVFGIALVLVGAAFAARETSRPPARPFVAVALASGMSGVGDGPSTPTGDHLRCWSGRHYAENLTLRNRSGDRVTLNGAASDLSAAPIVQRIAVQLRLAPWPPNGDVEVPGIRNWNRSAARPVTIPPGRSAWVQSNFLIHHCNLLAAHGTLIANRTITLKFTVNGHAGSQRIDLPSARIILTR
jgi:hypothetical protein